MCNLAFFLQPKGYNLRQNSLSQPNIWITRFNSKYQWNRQGLSKRCLNNPSWKKKVLDTENKNHFFFFTTVASIPGRMMQEAKQAPSAASQPQKSSWKSFSRTRETTPSTWMPAKKIRANSNNVISFKDDSEENNYLVLVKLSLLEKNL